MKTKILIIMKKILIDKLLLYLSFNFLDYNFLGDISKLMGNQLTEEKKQSRMEYE